MDIKVTKIKAKKYQMTLADVEINGQKDIAFLLQRTDGSSEWGLLNTHLGCNDHIALQKQLNAHYLVYTQL